MLYPPRREENPTIARDGKLAVMAEDFTYIVRKISDLGRFAGKKIVLTGGAGFVGSYLTAFLARLGAYGAPLKQLIVLDLFEAGVPAWIRELEEEGLPVSAEALDVTKDKLDQVLSDVDFVLHLASIASPSHYRKFPLQTLEANAFGLRNLLEACRGVRCEGILYFSSSEVYGSPPPESIPTPETYWGHVSSIGPRACYDESKRFGETLCSLYHQVYGLPIRIVRPFNNFGPGLNPSDGRVLADFARSALNDGELIIHSDGSPTRTYCYIADAVVGYLEALTYPIFDVFNIGSDGPEICVEELARLFAKVAEREFGLEPSVCFRTSGDADYLTDNPQRRCPDIGKARRLLGFAPEIELKDGIHRYLRSLRRVIS